MFIKDKPAMKMLNRVIILYHDFSDNIVASSTRSVLPRLILEVVAKVLY